mmetsp:Transcript_64581/g.151784  ORF Transcript_64581/g.151784 Transcript_64581/m.151784 type:complete len:271 (+) Transcript_64581:1058-1870(+)
MVPLVDTCLTSKAYLVISFCLQAGLLVLLQLFNLTICVLLKLPHGLRVHILGQALLLDDPLDCVPVSCLLLLELALHLIHSLLVVRDDPMMLLLPLPMDLLALGSQLLILVHLDHHLLLEGTLQFLILLGVVLQEALDVFLCFHLRVILLLPQHLVLLPLLVNLCRVPLVEFHHFLFVVALTMPELKLLLIGEFIHLTLELHKLRLLVIQECSSHKNLVCWRQSALLVALGDVSVFALDIENEEGSVLCGGEKEVIIESDPNSSSRCCMG